MDVIQDIGLSAHGHRIFNKGAQIELFVDKFLLVADVFEALEDISDLRICQSEAQMIETRDHGVSPAMLGQGQFRPTPADILWVHDLVGFAFLQYAILMNACAMCEGVLSD